MFKSKYTLPFGSIGDEIVSDQEIFQAASGKVSKALDAAGYFKGIDTAVDQISVTQLERKTVNKIGNLPSLTVFVTVAIELTFKENFEVPEAFEF